MNLNPAVVVLAAQGVILLIDFAAGGCGAIADEEGAARQGVRLAFDNGPGAALRRRGADKSPAPTAAPCPRPF